MNYIWYSCVIKNKLQCRETLNMLVNLSPQLKHIRKPPPILDREHMYFLPEIWK